MRRFSLLALLSVFGLLIAPLTLADDIPAPSTSTNCEGVTGDKRGVCIRDALKKWQREHEEYHKAERAAHKKWHEENDRRGLTPDFMDEHQALHKHTEVDHKAFHTEERRLQKLFHDAQAEARKVGEKTKTFTKRVSSTEEKGAERCNAIKDDRGRRTCLRLQLQLVDPAKKAWIDR